MIKVLLALLLIAASAYPTTLAQLRSQLRQRVNEQTSATIFPDSVANTWLNQSQDKITFIGGFIPKCCDIRIEEDSQSYALPADYKYHTGAVYRPSDDGVFYLPETKLYIGDSSNATYFVGWHTKDSARIYIKPGGTLQAGDSVRLFYNARALKMTSDTSTCGVPSDREVFIIEEAVSMFEMYKTAYQNWQAVRGAVREDVGIQKQVER